MSKKNRKPRRNRKRSRSASGSPQDPWPESSPSKTHVVSLDSDGPPRTVGGDYQIERGDMIMHEGNAAYAEAPRLLRSLGRLTPQQRVRRLQQILDELGDYRDGTGVLGLTEEELAVVRSLVEREPGVDGDILALALQRRIGGNVMMPLPRMVRLHRFLVERQSTSRLEAICQRVLVSVVGQLSAAMYFRKFDEQHLPPHLR